MLNTNFWRIRRDFASDVINLFHNITFGNRLILLPIIRAVRLLLVNRKEDYVYFRELVPKLREFANI